MLSMLLSADIVKRCGFQCQVVSVAAMLRRQMLTRAQEERMRAENRRKEYQREDHVKMVAQDRTLQAKMHSDQRVENKR